MIIKVSAGMRAGLLEKAGSENKLQRVGRLLLQSFMDGQLTVVGKAVVNISLPGPSLDNTVEVITPEMVRQIVSDALTRALGNQVQEISKVEPLAVPENPKTRKRTKEPLTYESVHIPLSPPK